MDICFSDTCITRDNITPRAYRVQGEMDKFFINASPKWLYDDDVNLFYNSLSICCHEQIHITLEKLGFNDYQEGFDWLILNFKTPIWKKWDETSKHAVQIETIISQNQFKICC